MSTERAGAAERATTWWRESTNSFLASGDYYERIERVLAEDVLPALGGRAGRVLDVGCGNGRFTVILAGSATNVVAVDIAPRLIEEARAEAERRGLGNTTFEVADLAHTVLPRGPFDLVSCMGVFSTMIVDEQVAELAADLVAKMAPGGHLLLRESLSTEPEDEAVLDVSPPAVYRSQAGYARMLVRLGLTPVMAARMKAWPKWKRENHILLLRKPRFAPLARMRFRRDPSRIFRAAIERTGK